MLYQRMDELQIRHFTPEPKILLTESRAIGECCKSGIITHTRTYKATLTQS